MTTRYRNEPGDYYSFSLRAVGDDYTATEPDYTVHKYSMRQDEQLCADIIEDTVNTRLVNHHGTDGLGHHWWWDTTEKESSSRIAWSAFGLTDSNALWQTAISSGRTIQQQFMLLDDRLVKKVAGEMIDPTMYLKEIDANFHMVVKRMTQAWEFLNNLKNPRKLARLTMRYFRGKETRRSLVRRYRRARSHFNLRSRRWRSTKISDAYLEYQFGWRPLVQDTVNLIKLAQNTVVRLRTHRVKVYLKPLTDHYVIPGGPYSDDAASNRAAVVDRTGGHARLSFQITNPAIRSLASMALPVYSVWDSIPFSFLADMATNVGDHLKNIGYHWGLDLLEGSNYRVAYRNLSVDFEMGTVEHWNPYYGAMPNSITTYRQTGRIYRKTIQTERQIITRWPDIPWIDKTPRILGNTQQIITLGALVHQWLAKAASRHFWNEVL